MEELLFIRALEEAYKAQKESKAKIKYIILLLMDKMASMNMMI